MARTLLFSVIAVSILWASGCALLYFEMRKPPEQFGRFMMRVPPAMAFLGFPFERLWTHARAGQVQVGDPAPDFDLLTTTKSERIRLSELNRRHPVVLIFGSYT